MRISDWSSDVCSSDLLVDLHCLPAADHRLPQGQQAGPDAQGLGPRSAGAPPVRRAGLAATAAGSIEKGRALRGLFLVPAGRSEEHTSEIQSLMRISYAVFCLKKKKKTT